jgi:flagellar export protein FliJ
VKSLHTLLKVAQRKLDELGVEAAKIGTEIAELRQREDNVRARERQEIATSAANTMFASMLPAYRLKIKWQIDQILYEIDGREKLLAEVRARMQDAYIEKSKFEQLIEQQNVREAAERAAKEQAMLDEVAINRAGGQKQGV